MVRRGISGELSAELVSPPGGELGACSLYLRCRNAFFAAGEPVVDDERESALFYKQSGFP
jgi:hypothetical protein